MNFYHYYDRRSGPFASLSDLPLEEAQGVLERIKRERPHSQCAQRHEKYVVYRRNCEAILLGEFRKKGGVIQRTPPYYMTVEHSPWLSTWFEDCGMVVIPAEAFNLHTLSFTYGDSMPAFSPKIQDGKEYRRKLYTYEEILPVIHRYGLPQNWNDDGSQGPERYIEVQIWSGETIRQYL